MAEKRAERAKVLFESRFMSIILMLCLVIMCVLFVVIIWQFFGKEPAIRVIRDLVIGVGIGLIITITILFYVESKKTKMTKNVLLYLVGIILIVSLIVAVIVKYSFTDPQLGSWAFIDVSSIGLGLTSGVAITYLILAMFKSKLIYRNKIEELNKNNDQEDKIEEEINK